MTRATRNVERRSQRGVFYPSCVLGDAPAHGTICREEPVFAGKVTSGVRNETSGQIWPSNTVAAVPCQPSLPRPARYRCDRRHHHRCEPWFAYPAAAPCKIPTSSTSILEAKGAQRLATGRHDFRTRCCAGLRGGSVVRQRCPVVCRLAGFRGRARRAVQGWYVRWRNRRILRASAWAARLCQEPSLDVLADINPFSIDELGEAIRRNADSCVGRAPSGHDLLETL